MGAQTAPTVPARATQGAEARDWSWVEASVWTDRMVSALVNGVKGGRWYSLIDAGQRPSSLKPGCSHYTAWLTARHPR